MRIVGGTVGGRRIEPPPSPARATTDRVREAIFSTLGSLGGVEGAAVADLFAGSGAMGIEALSRGAASVVFVDSDRRAVKTIRSNLMATGFEKTSAAGMRNARITGDPEAASTSQSGSCPRVEVVESDVLSWIWRGSERFDIAFCDPPYDFSRWEELVAHLEAGLLVAESDGSLPELAGWEVLRVKRYGGTVVTVMRMSGRSGEPGARPPDPAGA